MTVADLLARCEGAVGHRTVYRLGGGNLDPAAPTVQDEQRSADCSAFACWALGIRKYQPAMAWLVKINGGWLNTDGIWADADLPVGFFEEIAAPRSGCVIVYPSARMARARGPAVGHVGIVTQILGGGASLVTHCSSGNYRRSGDAIRQTTPEVFSRVAYTRFAWCAAVAR